MADPLESLIADAIRRAGLYEGWPLGAEDVPALTASVVAALRAAPPDVLAEALGMEQVGWMDAYGLQSQWVSDIEGVEREPVYRFVRP